jgi:hypothetical protein
MKPGHCRKAMPSVKSGGSNLREQIAHNDFSGIPEKLGPDTALRL